MKTIVCSICGGMVVDGKQKYHHAAKCGGYKQEGVDHVVCRECGYRSPMLSQHIRLHGMDDRRYLEKHPGAELVLKSIVERQSERKRAKGGYKPVSEKRGAVACAACGEWYQPETAMVHRQECVAAHSDKYVEEKDYVRCPECGCALLRLGGHLKTAHGWTNDRLAMESNKGLKLTAEVVRDRWAEGQDFEAIDAKRRDTVMERYGVENAFMSPVVKEKIAETSQRRYGASHAMKNEEVFLRQRKSSQAGPSAQEVFFDAHTCANVVFTGYGGRFVRTKTGVHKYGRLVKDLSPDFMVFPDNVLESALSASRERKPMDRQKHRTRYVVELLGDYYHSEAVIGVKHDEHVAEITEAYRSAGIECLVLWEKDVTGRWNEIEPMVSAWIDKAVASMNERPVWRKSTRSKVDRRKGDLLAGDGSGKAFRSRAMLERWLASPINYWRPGMEEGRDYVVCLECGTRVAKVVEHLRKSHGGMKKEEYLARHPGAPTVRG